MSGTWHGYDQPYHIILDLLNFCVQSPCGSAHQARIFFNMSVHDCVGKKNNTTLLQYYLFSTHAKSYQKHPVKKKTPRTAPGKRWYVAPWAKNELVRTAHFERSKLLRKKQFACCNEVYSWFLPWTMHKFWWWHVWLKRIRHNSFFLMRKMRIALFHYSHCPFLKYIIWPHNINYCCCFCCRFHAVLIFFPVRVVISVSLQPDIVVSLLFLLLFFLCLFS